MQSDVLLGGIIGGKYRCVQPDRTALQLTFLHNRLDAHTGEGRFADTFEAVDIREEGQKHEAGGDTKATYVVKMVKNHGRNDNGGKDKAARCTVSEWRAVLLR